MKDPTIDHSRPDAGEADKDIKTKGTSLKVHKAYEKRENFTVPEFKLKEAQQAEREPTPEEYSRRADRIRRVLGTLLGAGYGGAAGATVGGIMMHSGKFNKRDALRGLLIGMLGGSAAGYGAGTAYGKIKKYVGAKEPHELPPTIQIVVPPTPQVQQQVEEAMKQGSAVATTLAIFTGMKKVGLAGIGGGSVPRTPTSTPKQPKVPKAATQPGTPQKPIANAGNVMNPMPPGGVGPNRIVQPPQSAGIRMPANSVSTGARALGFSGGK